MNWNVEISDSTRCPVVRVVDRDSGVTVRRWAGSVARRMLARPGRPSTPRETLLHGTAASLGRAMALGTSRNGTATLAGRLREAGIQPTRQRIRVAEAVFEGPAHPTAEQVHDFIRQRGGGVARATVYNTLSLFTQAGLLRALNLEPGCTHFDTDTGHGGHAYDPDTGEVTDLPADTLAPETLQALLPDRQIEAISLVVRVKRRR